jgi:hypothetical protein
MSPSEEAERLSALVEGLRIQVERTIQAGELARVPPEGVTKLMSGAVKLYATAVEETEIDIPVIDGTVSTTEAMVVACALLRAHHLNPFDLALWFSRTAPKAP